LATDTYSKVVTEYKYDQHGRRTSVIADQGGAALETAYEYDYQGRVKKTTLPNGKWTETHRDGRGMVRVQIVGHDSMEDENDWLVTLFYYDARGNLSEKVTPDNVSTVYKYDDFDRLVMVRKGL
jgi:YD repeat-containing protein